MRAARATAAARCGHVAASLLLVAAAVPAATAQEGWVAVRGVDHGGHGRIVFDSRTAPSYVLEQQGDRAILRFSPPVPLDLSEVSRPPRNVLGVVATAGGVEIALRPGARAPSADRVEGCRRRA
jgi:hypothetical protein